MARRPNSGVKTFTGQALGAGVGFLPRARVEDGIVWKAFRRERDADARFLRARQPLAEPTDDSGTAPSRLKTGAPT